MPANQWVTIDLTYDETGAEAAVNGEERARIKGNFTGLREPLTVKNGGHSIVTVHTFEVAPGAGSR